MFIIVNILLAIISGSSLVFVFIIVIVIIAVVIVIVVIVVVITVTPTRWFNELVIPFTFVTPAGA